MEIWTIEVTYHKDDPVKKVVKNIGTFNIKDTSDPNFLTFLDAYFDVRLLVQTDVPIETRGVHYGVVHKKLSA